MTSPVGPPYTGTYRPLNPRVALTGIGGDQLLMFLPSYWLDWLRQGRLGLLAAAAWHHLRLFHRPPAAYWWAAFHHLRHRSDRVTQVPDWVEPSSLTSLAARARTLDTQRCKQAGTLDPSLWSAFFGWADPGFTRLQLHFRHPFFDVRLVEYLRSLPPVPWFPNKMLLREAMRPVLPDALLTRPKTPLVRDPEQAVIRQQGFPPGTLQMVAGFAGLDRFLDRKKFARRLEIAREAPTLTCHALSRSLALVQWLRYRRRPQWTSVRSVSPDAFAQTNRADLHLSPVP